MAWPGPRLGRGGPGPPCGRLGVVLGRTTAPPGGAAGHPGAARIRFRPESGSAQNQVPARIRFRPRMASNGLGTTKNPPEPYIWSDYFQVSSNSIVIGPFFGVGGSGGLWFRPQTPKFFPRFGPDWPPTASGPQKLTRSHFLNIYFFGPLDPPGPPGRAPDPP